jgi:hypothetical protein
MIRRPFVIFPITILLFFASCRAGRVPVSAVREYASADSYIDSYKDLAVSEMQRTGVPASITLAQGIIESDLGRSRLAREANNHFGIKCHDDWKGPSVRHSDDRRNECFRKYKRPEESYKDHSDFLRSESRYKSLFQLDVTDYKGWARGLKKSGYATNPDYANMLIRKIEELNLNRFDSGIAKTGKSDKQNEAVEIKESGLDITKNKQAQDTVANYSLTFAPSRIKEKNRIQYIVAKDGDTQESLEKEFQLLKWELERYNELKPGFKINSGQIFFLQPKRDKADIGNDFHTAAEGETMYMISQIYGIKLKSLLNMNRMAEGQNPATGQKIWLRSVKPVD